MAQNDGLNFDNFGGGGPNGGGPNGGEANPWAISENGQAFDAGSPSYDAGHSPYDAANPYSYSVGADAPWDNQFTQTSMMAPVPGAPGTPGAQSPRGSNRGLTIAIAVLAVILIALVGGVAWVLVGNKGDSSATAIADSAPAQEPNDETVVVTETSTARRAENFSPLSGWSSCDAEGRSGDYGNFDRCFKSGATSAGFADNLFKAFRQQYQQTHNTEPVLRDVVSPQTGQAYDMTCVDSGDYVTCSGGKYIGGDNAHVHIV